MPITCDTHMHSSFSADSETPMEAQVRAAIKKGLTMICFTEHVDLDWPYDNTPADGSDSIPFDVDWDACREEFFRLKEIYKDRISLRLGVEMGLNAAFADEISDYIASHPFFEYIIGSTHSSRHKDPYYPSFFDDIPVASAVQKYFEDSLENVRTCPFFDSYGHLDYALRYSMPRCSGEFLESLKGRGLSYSDWAYMQNADVIDEILRELIRGGKALEVNTQALKKGFPETNPGKAVLSRYRSLGGKLITVGCDAHVPDAVGYGLDIAEKTLRSCGFSEYCTFEDRKPVHHLL